MTTFRLFPRLPLELRINIWECVAEERALKVARRHYKSAERGFCSPTLTPAVTKTSQESRKYSSYRKSFVVESSPRYIWANFEYDVIHMSGGMLASEFLQKAGIMHLRIQLVNENGFDESESFFYSYSRSICEFPLLRSFDLLVAGGLAHTWTSFIRETYWGECRRRNVRIVDGKTGEYIDAKTSGPYQDYIDTHGGENDWYTRIPPDHEDEEERVEAMKRLQMPLPRIDLDY